MVSEDIDRLTGTYRVSPGGFVVVHQAMGTEPYYPFKRMVITRRRETSSLDSEAEIRKKFVRGEAYLYEFKISGM